MKLKIRCPSCAKLYEVESEEILSDVPVFQCISCEDRFGFNYPPDDFKNISAFKISKSVDFIKNNEPEVSGTSKSAASSEIEFPLEFDSISSDSLKSEIKTRGLSPNLKKTEFNQQLKACPKCGALNGPRVSECYSCHVIFEKLEGLPVDPTLRAQPSLVRKWKNILENFDDVQLHDEFIRTCHSLDALRFAMLKYKEIKTAQGGDVLCEQMIGKIESLMMVGLEQRPTSMASESIMRNERPKWFKYLYWTPFSLSGLLILWGILSLGHRNLIGVGVALVCMSAGLIVMFKGKLSFSDFVD